MAPFRRHKINVIPAKAGTLRIGQIQAFAGMEVPGVTGLFEEGQTADKAISPARRRSD
jgi:hypothetical protein